MTKIGLHMPGGTATAIQVANILQAEVLTWATGFGVTSDDGRKFPNATHIVRLPNINPGDDPRSYCFSVLPWVRDWKNSGLDVWFILGNEPDLEEWSVDQWLLHFPDFVQSFRQVYPGSRVLCTPLSVEKTQYVTEAVANICDGLAGHTYWQENHPEDIYNPNLGGSWQYLARLARGRPVFITEVNSAPRDGFDPQGIYTNTDQCAEWFNTLTQEVTGVCFYLADGVSFPPWGPWSWLPEHATSFMAAIRTPPQPPIPPSNPYEYDGEYSYDTFMSMMQGPLTDKNPTASSRDNYLGAHGAGKAQNVSVETLVGWIKAENVDPELIAVNNLAGIEYVGQPRAYRSSARFPPNEETNGPRYYAGFDTPLDFWITLAINIRTINPTAWLQGDLRTIAKEYTGGSWGEAKVTLVDELRDTNKYPHGNLDAMSEFLIVRPVGCDVLQGSDGAFSHGGKVPGFYAIDYGCGIGTPVRAAADGVVLYAYWQDSNPISLRTGHSLYIAHDNGYSTFSCHLEQFNVAQGDRVTQGEIIGLTGDPASQTNNGFGDGPHLHWEIWQGIWGQGGSRIKMEDLEADGIAGPWEDIPQEDPLSFPVTNQWDEGLLKNMWQSLKAGSINPKTKRMTAARPIDYNPDAGIFQSWVSLIQDKKQPGVPCTQERDWGDGRVTQNFTSGRMAEYNKNDGSVTWH